MGLLPLEFSDCLLDSPYFRENLRAHERQLDQTAADIKGIERDVRGVLEAARLLSKAKRALANSLSGFQFDCLGTSLTDDEVIIANSLREFSRFLGLVEDEMDRMLENAHEKFIAPLEAFRKEQIGSVKKTKKDFDKQTARFCQVQDRYVNLSSKKEESLAEAAEQVRYEQRSLNASSLEYVYLMHVVQERKKVEFVEAIVSFMQSWATYYKHGLSVTADFSNYMSDLGARVQKTRGNYSATVEQYDSLKQKMRTAGSSGHLLLDPGLLNKMYTRQGYLYAQNHRKNNIKIGSQWTKYYCQYQAKPKTLTMISYNQLAGKIATTETIRVHECVCKEETTEKFRFVVTAEDVNEQGSIVTHTFQALSDYERKHWVEAMGGTWPAMNTLQRIRADSVEENLNSLAFTFLKDCLAELEARGLGDQGLYRVGGVVSKVKKLLNQGLEKNEEDPPLELSDPKQWESKTIASAVKQYFRDLSKPLMTHNLYSQFVAAVKHESEEERLAEIQIVMQKLPIASREMLKVLVRHLNKVATRSDVNLMTASNLGVCFGPTLLRPKEETVASIMDIKFCNEVVEILIQNCDRFFNSSSPEVSSHRQKRNSSSANSSLGGEDVTDHHRAKRGSSTPLRVNSLSSFSQLSTNSLPDIKEFKMSLVPPATMTMSSQQQQQQERPRSKSHQLQSPMQQQQSSLFPNYSPLPPPPPLVKSSTQDDLMASLEMMNQLAADLPAAVSPLKRSLTLQPSNMRSRMTLEVTRKPPLPRLSLSATTTTTVNSGDVHHQHRFNSSPSPSSASDSATSASASPRTQRGQQAQLVIEERNELSSAPCITQAPAVPVRKYRRVIVSPPSILPEETKASVNQHAVVTEDTCRTEFPLLSDESSSSALSVDCSSGGSKYDNVVEEQPLDNTCSAADAASSENNDQSRDDDGDDEAEASETSSIISDSSNHQLTDCIRSNLPQPDLLPSSNNNSIPLRVHQLTTLQRRNSRNRDSGPYENVPNYPNDFGPQQQKEDVYKHQRPQPIRTDFWERSEEQQRDNDSLKLAEEEERYGGSAAAAAAAGMSSLRSLLTVAHKTTNV